MLLIDRITARAQNYRNLGYDSFEPLDHNLKNSNSGVEMNDPMLPCCLVGKDAHGEVNCRVLADLEGRNEVRVLTCVVDGYAA